MPRNMSFSMTTEQARNKTKTVTRRYGWANLKAGDVIQQVEKAMGLKKGEKPVKIHLIRAVEVTREPLTAIRDYPNDCELEGFPDWTPDQFIDFLTSKSGKSPDELVTRIRFEYI
jgi:hypothetical protein